MNERKTTIYTKIQAISNEIKGIEKDMTVGEGHSSYKAVSDMSVMLKIKEAESKFGLLSIPCKQELINSEILKSAPDQYGKVRTTFVDTVKMTTKIIDLDNTTDFIEIESYGRGVDSSDKGFGKASTYARKYALLNAYKIATGVDPDNTPSIAPEVQHDAEVKNLKVQNYLLSHDEYKEQIFQHFGLGSLDELTTKEVAAIYLNLTNKGLL